jgi:hypothetical protein
MKTHFATTTLADQVENKTCIYDRDYTNLIEIE